MLESTRYLQSAAWNLCRWSKFTPLTDRVQRLAWNTLNITQPFAFEATCNYLWNGTIVPYPQHDREAFDLVGDLENTRVIKFRLKKTLNSGATVSILKRAVARRFFDENRMVMVFQIFSEGEGMFSGMDTDETS
ncbi:hypothetical protein L917_12835 [Phytophthora nicotianae]|uniref:Uncharacterized protein n=2 Tax=Phytophthora nicotianae TaxID=4792 RepID=W2R585_PHYN3|nr:hypothetical protein PPTG_03417 [Phytophthora nicotianae INRA-310]ETK81399.1 hypothetical protein L915_13104 [Phytophthora nicotianae]ETL34824.1 hypothetical protein L916_12995 [Phytophthora nicotianae]ETL88068.1 hypothetical protein L917_12835 [Phytophthora nicotianae]ETN20401.1 hypothetical protein PPTG_03417 [Phytophthora nicotianae INRA-310]